MDKGGITIVSGWPALGMVGAYVAFLNRGAITDAVLDTVGAVADFGARMIHQGGNVQQALPAIETKAEIAKRLFEELDETVDVRALREHKPTDAEIESLLNDTGDAIDEAKVTRMLATKREALRASAHVSPVVEEAEETADEIRASFEAGTPSQQALFQNEKRLHTLADVRLSDAQWASLKKTPASVEQMSGFILAAIEKVIADKELFVIPHDITNGGDVRTAYLTQVVHPILRGEDAQALEEIPVVAGALKKVEEVPPAVTPPGRHTLVEDVRRSPELPKMTGVAPDLLASAQHGSSPLSSKPPHEVLYPSAKTLASMSVVRKPSAPDKVEGVVDAERSGGRATTSSPSVVEKSRKKTATSEEQHAAARLLPKKRKGTKKPAPPKAVKKTKSVEQGSWARYMNRITVQPTDSFVVARIRNIAKIITYILFPLAAITRFAICPLIDRFSVTDETKRAARKVKKGGNKRTIASKTELKK